LRHRGPLISAGVSLLALLIFAIVTATRYNPSASDSTNVIASATLHIGSVAPTKFSLDELSGPKTETLAALVHGRPAIINFFASWCPICLKELDAFGAYSRQKPAQISIVGIDTNDTSLSTSRRLLAAAGAKYPVLVDTNGLAVATAYGIDPLPVTFFVASNGKVVSEAVGGLTLAELQKQGAATLAASSVP
jgi:thiol-disulfide isomerase/thioredoxin